MTGDPTVFYLVAVAILFFLLGGWVGQERKPKKK